MSLVPPEIYSSPRSLTRSADRRGLGQVLSEARGWHVRQTDEAGALGARHLQTGPPISRQRKASQCKGREENNTA